MVILGTVVGLGAVTWELWSDWELLRTGHGALEEGGVALNQTASQLVDAHT